MSVSKRKAKSLSVKMWKYLVEHPTEDKRDAIRALGIPEVMNMEAHCPLCEYNMRFGAGIAACPECVIMKTHSVSCFNPTSPFAAWYEAKTVKARKDAAQKILDAIKGWEVK